MFEPMFKPNKPTPYLNKAGKNARQVQIRECFPQPLKERLDEGSSGGRKTLSEIEIFFVFHRKRRRSRMAYGAYYLKGTHTLFRPR